jgi:hypothetical protein
MKRTTEFVLGLIGGIFGFGGGFLSLFFGAVDEAVSGSSEITSLAWSAIVASIMAIIGSIVVKFKARIGGAMMLISAIWGVISVSLFYVLPGLLLLIAGLLSFRKPKEEKAAA